MSKAKTDSSKASLKKKKEKVSKQKEDNRSELKKEITQLVEWVVKGEKALQEFSSKVEGFEETLLCLQHNIKKNQFLYAHYPEDWVKSYQDLKEGMKHENEFMQSKITKLENNEKTN